MEWSGNRLSLTVEDSRYSACQARLPGDPTVPGRTTTDTRLRHCRRISLGAAGDKLGISPPARGRSFTSVMRAAPDFQSEDRLFCGAIRLQLVLDERPKHLKRNLIGGVGE